MLWLGILSSIAWLLRCTIALDNNLTTLVSWDKYSLSINGERTFIFAGEFHYQRLPVPELWSDIFQKFRAQGLNTVSIYFFWSYHSPSPGIYDFETGAKDVQRLLDAAKDAGLWVIARPGPYCNAETNAGGFALWTTDGSGGKYRTSDEVYHQAWLPWVQRIGNILTRNQITNGGPVILVQVENELQQTVHQKEHTLVKYMEQVEKAFKDAGIVVPFTHNEKGMRSQSWSSDYQNVGGAVNVYGLDSYPGGLSCSDRNKGFQLVRTYHEWFRSYSFTQPSFMPEFEAGDFQPYGGEFYDHCEAELDPAFVDVYYKNNIGQRITLLALYMAYGGTSWGHSAAPVVYTSYDYAAPLRETRQIRDKFKQVKLLSLFTRVSKDLLKTDLVGSGRGYSNSTQAIWTWHLRNPDTGASFYTLQQHDSPSRSLQKSALTVQTSSGPVHIPEITLDGRQSKIIATDYRLNDSLTLLYSSAEILAYSIMRRPILVMYLKEGQRGEFAWKDASYANFTIYGPNQPVNAKTEHFQRFSWQQKKGYSVVDFEDIGSRTSNTRPLVLLLDMPTAWSFFAPATTKNPHVHPEQQIFVLGPYLVRNTTVIGNTLHIVGDHDLESTSAQVLEAYVGDPLVSTISWNQRDLKTTRTPYGALWVELPNDHPQVKLPDLIMADWRGTDSFPEVSNDYDHSNWTVCNRTTNRSPVKPLSLPILYSSDYGYHTGIKIYRGTFSAKTARRVNITVSQGEAAGWNAWLNGQLLGGEFGEPRAKGSKVAPDSTTWAMLGFGNLVVEGKNVITVLCDYHGHDQTSVRPSGGENPRGILGVTLFGEPGEKLKFDEWRIMGNAGAGPSAINNDDPVRGPMNEGGLYGERMGWHLPGFDTSKWSKESPLEGIGRAGVHWYTTTFELDIPSKLDVPIGIELDAVDGLPARVQLFMNGYQYGKYIPHIGPQTRFPIPPGIINAKGSNTLALSVWAQTDRGARISRVRLIRYGIYDSGYDFSGDWSYLRPNWTAQRLKYH